MKSQGSVLFKSSQYLANVKTHLEYNNSNWYFLHNTDNRLYMYSWTVTKYTTKTFTAKSVLNNNEQLLYMTGKNRSQKIFLMSNRTNTHQHTMKYEHHIQKLTYDSAASVHSRRINFSYSSTE